MSTNTPALGKISVVTGRAAALDIANLDTDQIMPKQFLRGIDKAGLAQGLFYDLRYDGEGHARADCALHRPGFAGVNVLFAAANYGCGSSREHAVWGMQQYGFEAVVAPSFGEIFYSNAINNRLLPAMVAEADAQAFLHEAAASDGPLAVEVDVARLQVRTPGHRAPFTLSERHQRMFLEGLDVIGASLAYAPQIAAFAQAHWQREPWVRDVARGVRDRLAASPGC